MGCPFAGYAKPQLHDVLRKNEGLPEHVVSDIMKDVQQGAYQVACKKYFDVKHPGNTNQDLVIKHPNSYFDKSMKHWAALAAGPSAAATTITKATTSS